MNVAIYLFDRVTALDAIGPYEVLCRVPGWEVEFVAAEAGPVETDTGITAISATRPVSRAGSADLLLVPGGAGSRPLISFEYFFSVGCEATKHIFAPPSVDV